MKKFSIKHLVYGTEKFYTEDNLPGWMDTEDFKWFRDEYVLSLNVGEMKNAEHLLITRIE